MTDYFKNIPEDEKAQVEQEVNSILDTWEKHIEYFDENSEWGSMGSQIVDEDLLQNYGSSFINERNVKINLMTSMRNVDTSSAPEIIRPFVLNE